MNPDTRTLPPLAAVCASTYDLPTIDGWVAGLAREPNLPGTPDKAPHGRQSLPISLESLVDEPR
jgi:hypothetical protein